MLALYPIGFASLEFQLDSHVRLVGGDRCHDSLEALHSNHIKFRFYISGVNPNLSIVNEL